MKKIKSNFLLILGVVIILAGITLPIIFFNQTTYYTQTSNTIFGKKTYEFSVYSNKNLDVNKFVISIEYLDGEVKKFEIEYFIENFEGDNYLAEFDLEVEQYGFIQDLKLTAVGENEFEIKEKLNSNSKLPIMLISSAVGISLIVLCLVNKKQDKNKVVKIETESIEKVEEKPLYRTCDYCGNSVENNKTTCPNCGAKLK